jgi:extracellular factor (EF) 3-hydroxypalmitic acid methyl ester biosynthesis protein
LFEADSSRGGILVGDNNREQAIAALKDAFPALETEDLHLLLETGTITEAQEGSVIVKEGARPRGLMTIVRGTARVMRGQPADMIAFATMSAGELVGEISFLDRKAASATVVANKSLSVLHIEESQINALLHSVPGFATRLYQSLAHSLTKRLRERTALIPPFTIEDVPQVRRFHAARTTALGEAPEEFVAAVEEFKRAMLETQTQLKDRNHDIEVSTKKVRSACTEANNVIDRYVTESPTPEALGAYAFRETFSFMMSSSLLERIYVKPRGYAGDFETIEDIYSGSPVGASTIGQMVDEWARTSGTAQAVRHRRSKLLDDMSAFIRTSKGTCPLHVTSLAVGPGREIFDLLDAHHSAPIRFFGIDIDDAALGFCADQARNRAIEKGKLNLFQDNLIKLSLGRGRVTIPKQDFIYSMGLIDYLEDRLVLLLINWAFEQLSPGGTLALGNFATGNPYKAFMDHIVEWVLIHRTPDQIRELFAQSKFGNANVRLDTDPTGIQLFAYCLKE